jgi:hypothetical protein
MQVIWLVEKLQTQGFQTARHWMTVFITVFSAITLVWFTLSDQDNPTAEDARASIQKAKFILHKMENLNPVARKCSGILAVCSASK